MFIRNYERHVQTMFVLAGGHGFATSGCLVRDEHLVIGDILLQRFC